MQFSRRSLPAFELRPPDWLERLFGPPPASPRASANEAFVQEYRLRCEPSGTERLISEEVIAFFADRPGWTVEGAGDRLLVYRARRLVNPDAVPELLAAALDILARFARAV
jgi:hypothetical protein